MIFVGFFHSNAGKNIIDKQKTTQKTEDWAARIPLKTRTELCRWQLESLILYLFNGKGLKTKHMIFVGLFHSNAGKNIIDNFS
jgi:hypothetical protein